MIFKTAVLVWKCLRRSATLGLPGRPLCAGGVYRRSSPVSLMQSPVPWTRTSTGQRNFAVYGLGTWNRLPTALRSPELSLSSLKRPFKTHLFQQQNAPLQQAETTTQLAGTITVTELEPSDILLILRLFWRCECNVQRSRKISVVHEMLRPIR